MKNLILAFRSLLKKDQNNIIKIASLGVGLAVGLVLVSKVFFDNSYDDFFPDSDRIYQIQSNVEMPKEPSEGYGQVSGGIAPGMKAEVAGVEMATRFTYLSKDGVFYTTDKNSYSASVILADTCFFDVLPLTMISGKAKEVLSQPMYAIVSRSVAEKIGGDVIGQTIRLDNYPKKEITVGGIFEDVPENSHLKYDIVVSLVSISNFMSDGTQNWIGNDRYLGYVKLAHGVNPDDLAPAIRQMQIKNQGIEEIEKKGIKLFYSFIPLTKIHSDTPETKRMTILLSAIAFALLFTAVMNYILLVISGLVSRAKTIAVCKCYGAEKKDITKIIFTEALLHLLLSLVIAVLLIFCFRGMVEDILSASVSALFSLRTCAFLLIICFFILLIVGYIPSSLFTRIPVASVFRNLRATRNGWKVVLLFMQIVATAFLANLLIIVSQQYNTMINDNPGYKYENVLYSKLSGVNVGERQKIVDELRRLPEVDEVATSSTLLFESKSGNNVSLPDTDNDLFNIADLYPADENYFPLLGVSVIEGKGFEKGKSAVTDIMVSKSFVEKLITFTGWKDGVVGKEVLISEHNYKETTKGTYVHYPVQIIGVYDELRLGSISDQDTRPSVIFYSGVPSPFILIKMHELNSDNIGKVYDVFKTVLPDKEIVVTPYKESMVGLYKDSKKFRNAITIGGLVTIIITLIGLIGYTTNEVNRRRSEIAVRKINGASLFEILSLFVKNNLWVTIPALVCGSIVAAIAGIKWMEDFSEKVALSPCPFISCGLAIMLIILGVVVLSCIRVANENPVESLKSE